MAEKALISSTIQGRDWGYLFLLYLIVNVARFLGVFLFFPTLARGPYGISWRQAMLLSWGGLRGAVSLTLSMAVSQQEEIPLETRARISFLTAGIVLLTILINGSTCKLLLRMLKLNNPTEAEQELFIRATNVMENELEEFLNSKLKKDKYLGNADWNVVYRYLPVLSPQIYWHRVREGHISLNEGEIGLLGKYIQEEEEKEEAAAAEEEEEQAEKQVEGADEEGRRKEVGKGGEGGKEVWSYGASCLGRGKEGGKGGVVVAVGSRYEELPPRLRNRWKRYTQKFNQRLKEGIDGEKLSEIRRQVWESLLLARGVFPPLLLRSLLRQRSRGRRMGRDRGRKGGGGRLQPG